MINWWDTRFFFLSFKTVFKIDQYAFGLVVGSINLVKIRVQYCSFDFSIVALGASVCFEIFEITEYLRYFENNISWQNSFSVLALLFC